jgi:branched-chain amino acid transport system permease protein
VSILASVNIAQVAVDGIGLGCIYALAALGIALIFGIMRLINFAHAELIMISAYMALLLAGTPWPVLVTGVIVVTIGSALIMERVAFRPVRTASPSTLLITSFALAYLLQNLAILTLGSTTRSVTLPRFVVQSVSIGGIETLKLNVLTIVLTLVLMAGLALFLKRARLGVQMRAASEDFVMARLLGVRANTVIATAFAISGALAGIAGLILVAQTGSVEPTIADNLVLVGFVATIVGGLGSISAAAAAGLLLGIIDTCLQIYLPLSLKSFSDAFLYAIVFLILLTRPQGLLVVHAGERTV